MNIRQDLRYALRRLPKNPGFAAVAIVNSSPRYGCGHGNLHRRVRRVAAAAYAHPDRIMALFEVHPKGGRRRLSDPTIRSAESRPSACSPLADLESVGVVVHEPGKMNRLTAKYLLHLTGHGCGLAFAIESLEIEQRIGVPLG